MPEPSRLLSRVWIENFKAIPSFSLDLRPLTVLVGENSAGKSSVFQAILLMAQTASRPTINDLVSLNGSEVELGNFVDVVHNGNTSQRITIGVSVHPDIGIPRRKGSSRFVRRRVDSDADEDAGWELTIGAPEDGLGIARIDKIEIRDRRAGQRLEVVANDDIDAVEALYEHSRRLGLVRSMPPVRTRLLGEAHKVARFKGNLYSDSADDPASEDTFPAVAVDGALPVELFSYTSEREALARRWIDIALRRTELERERWAQRRTLRELRQERQQTLGLEADIAAELFPRFLRWVDELNRSAEPVPGPSVDTLEPDQLSLVRLSREAVIGQLAELLETNWQEQGAIESRPSTLTDLGAGFRSLCQTAIHYLGPLRADPAPSYRPGQTGGIAPLGLKGEFTVSTLHTFRNYETLCPLRSGETKPMKLGDAVDYWLKEFAVAGGITTREIGRPGIEVALVDAQTNASRDLTGVGVGVSQLLPVLVLCLLAQPGELILLEQPELHLHPAPQQILGDFLLNVATSGRQLLVETHSEYLINRLRLRVVDDQFGDISELIHIWYARREEGRTSFELLKPNRFGAFDEWPEGFFDQAPREAEAILRAAAKKRRAT